AMKELSKSLRLEYLQYKELLQMTQLRTTGLSKEAEAKLKRGEVINQLIIQDKNEPVAMEAQILYLFALAKGILDKLSVAQIKQFKQEFLEFVEKSCPGFSKELRDSQALTDEAKHKIEACLKEYLQGLIK
ncbi:MAG: hypothetical protein NT066_03605, partial [Candidatus Omnitrophica bacterium]|nr:hypothetical protein [Candidatus Omnitrophota bacterium]